MPTEPSGPIARTQELWRLMLAELSGVQEFFGVESSSAAAARIYRGMIPNPADDNPAHTLAELQEYRPYIIASNLGFTKTADAEGTFRSGGTLSALFVRDLTAEEIDDLPDAELVMNNLMGLLMEQIADRYMQPGWLDINRIHAEPPLFASQEERAGMGDFIECELIVSWGRQG